MLGAKSAPARPRSCSAIRRISTATGSSPGAATSSAADDDGGFTPRRRLADFSVDRAHSPAATNAATTTLHNTAETRPTTSLIATTATGTSTKPASTRLAITPLHHRGVVG